MTTPQGSPATKPPRCRLIFDLDNTLVCAMTVRFRELAPPHTIREEEWSTWAHLDVTPIERPTYHIYPRPGLTALLLSLRRHPDVEVAIWTAASCGYAAGILARVAPWFTPDLLWGRSSCETRTLNGKTKKFKNFSTHPWSHDPTPTLFFDDRPDTILAPAQVLATIPSYTGDPEDHALLDLRHHLASLLDTTSQPPLDATTLNTTLGWDQPHDPHAWFDTAGWSFEMSPGWRPRRKRS